MQKMSRLQIKSYKKVKSMSKEIKLTSYSNDTKTGHKTSIYKINLHKMVEDEIKSKQKLYIIFKVFRTQSKSPSGSNMHQIAWF